MKRLFWAASFRRAVRRQVSRQPELRDRISSTLQRLQHDPFDPVLRTHKLSGELKGLWACRVAYDCRIVFAIEKDEEAGDELIVLIDLGTHDEVY